MGFLRRQLVVSGLVANAVRPAPLYSAGVPAMFAGWLTSELAAHILVGTAVDSVRETVRGDRRRALLGVVNIAALSYLLRQGGSSSPARRGHTIFSGRVEAARREPTISSQDWTSAVDMPALRRSTGSRMPVATSPTGRGLP